MKKQRSAAIVIRVHQEDRVPWKVMNASMVCLDQNTKQGSDHVADTTSQQRTANNGRRDRIHLKAFRLLYETAQGVQTKQDAANSA